MAKIAVRYIGSNESALISNRPGIPSIQFNRYGQLVEMDEDVYYAIISGRYGAKLAIMTDEEFELLEHSPEELERHGNPRSHAAASEEFKEKVRRANAMLLDIHAAALET